ncbi:MAG: zinc metallopeptidase [Clostridia bacterium]|nr:zinc metallopeptidase [Clostridia bacterium]
MLDSVACFISAANAYDAYLLYIIVTVLIIPIFLFGIIASVKVNSTFSKYSRVDSRTNLTAAEAARKVLDSEGLQDVTIRRIRGNLTDNYNPSTKVLSLSDSVYDSTSVAALGVACHEAGHAIQHAKKYPFATLRIKLVPLLNFANTFLWPLFIIGLIFGFVGFGGIIGDVFLIIGMVIFGGSLLFALVTLPTEFDASRRALAVLGNGYMSGNELGGAKKVLRAAAMTYIASFLMSAIQFLRMLAIFLMNRRD